jgi:hypothetical protein
MKVHVTYQQLTTSLSRLKDWGAPPHAIKCLQAGGFRKVMDLQYVTRGVLRKHVARWLLDDKTLHEFCAALKLFVLNKPKPREQMQKELGTALNRMFPKKRGSYAKRTEAREDGRGRFPRSLR